MTPDSGCVHEYKPVGSDLGGARRSNGVARGAYDSPHVPRLLRFHRCGVKIEARGSKRSRFSVARTRKPTPMIRFYCHHCGTLIQSADTAVGRDAMCPGCSSMLVIPAVSTAFPPPPPPPAPA